MDFFKWITDWYGRYQVVQSFVAVLKAILLPFGIAAMTALAGFSGKAPFMWICMATSLASMGTVVTVFFVFLLGDLRTPANKLRYVNTVVNVDFGGPPNRRAGRAAKSLSQNGPQQSYLDKCQVGVQLHNSASFPISAFMELASTKIEGKQPPRSTFPKLPVTIVPGSIVNMTDEAIELNSLPCGKLAGSMDIKIRYGKKGRERFELIFKANIEVFMRRDGFVNGIATAWDTNKIAAISPPA